jgi:hypothetical protein
MPPVGFKPIISAGEWPQTYALDSAATGTGPKQCLQKINMKVSCPMTYNMLKTCTAFKNTLIGSTKGVKKSYATRLYVAS